MCREGMISLGLPVLCGISKIQDHSTLATFTSNKLAVGSLVSWVAETVDEIEQDRRRENWYSDRDAAQDRRDDMPFNGDREDLPPLAWVMIWRGTYSNMYGEYLDEDLRDWGYIMWDASRVMNSGKAASLDKLWIRTDRNGDEYTRDPRDHVV